KDVYPEKWDLDTLFSYVHQFFPLCWGKDSLDLNTLTQVEVKEKLLNSAKEIYKEREEKFGFDMIRELERRIMLWVVDSNWREHLAEMDYLREGIGLRAIGQKDPLVEYRNEAYLAWEQMNQEIKRDFVKYVFHVEVVSEGAGERKRMVVETSRPSQSQKKAKKVGRNEPCPCGSGLKYKKCCGK
ncbi:MAG: SEC-C metal-binding domain-containing protein, partial [Candidatus Subteraquimicrobiales bacterium]|nr:SEC-C metal-binding domain-containing protein [Candidatus Subteraquimicrobiales bacterium]